MSLKLVKSAKRPPAQQSPTDTPSEAEQNVLLLENEVGFSDATRLNSPDENSFVQNLKFRFLSKQIYVSGC
jgi:hypothetical protein